MGPGEPLAHLVGANRSLLFIRCGGWPKEDDEMPAARPGFHLDDLLKPAVRCASENQGQLVGDEFCQLLIARQVLFPHR